MSYPVGFKRLSIDPRVEFLTLKEKEAIEILVELQNESSVDQNANQSNEQQGSTIDLENNPAINSLNRSARKEDD